MTTYVCYHIPSDRDDCDHPNAFAVNKSVDEITLKDIKDAFPLPGEYHFRFKVRMDGGVTYWIDFNDDTALVPGWGPRRIVAKVLRLSWTGKKSAPKVSSEPVNRPTARVEAPRSSHVDLFGGSSPPKSRNAVPSNGVTELDLFS